MKLRTCTLALLLFCMCLMPVLNAQVKIGDNPNNIETASLFELESTDKGFLPPRIPLNNITTWAPLAGTAVEGMVVYSDAGALQDGFYYWDGTQWVRLSGAQDAEWLDANINGNPLILARQAAATGDTVVIADNGRLGVGTSNPIDLVHVNGAATEEVRFSLGSTESFRFGRHLGRSRIFSGNTLELQSNNPTTGVMISKNDGNPGGNTTVFQIGGSAIGNLLPTAKLFNANGRFVIQVNGNTGIDKFLPTTKLDVVGVSRSSRGTISGNTGHVAFSAAGRIGGTAANEYIQVTVPLNGLATNGDRGYTIRMLHKNYIQASFSGRLLSEDIVLFHVDITGNGAPTNYDVRVEADKLQSSYEYDFDFDVPGNALHLNIRPTRLNGSGRTSAIDLYMTSRNNTAFDQQIIEDWVKDASAALLTQPSLSTQTVPLSTATEWTDANINGTDLILATQAADNGDTVVVTDNGQLAVGTTDVTRGDLIVSGDFRSQPSGDANITVLSNNAFAQDIGGKIALGGAASATDLTRTYASIAGLKENATAANRAGYMQFNVRSGTSPADLYEAMRITSLGNVGIGTLNPTRKLHVEGNAFFSNLTSHGNTASFGTGGSGAGIISWTVNAFRVRGENGHALRLDANGNLSTNPAHLEIKTSGNISAANYPNTRNDATTTATENLLYTDIAGNLLSTPLTAIVDSTKDADWYEISTNDSPDDINDFIYTRGRVAIGSTTTSGDLNVGGSQIISFVGTAPSSSLTSPGSLIINANSGNANITTRAEEFRFNGFDAGTLSTVNMRGVDANHVALTLGLNTGQTRNVMQITDDANLPVTVFDNEGHLGVGTAAPLGHLHVDNPAVYSSDNALVANSSIVLRGAVNNAVGDHFGGITWATSAARKRAGISSVMENTDSDFVGLAFWTQGIDGPGPMAESMRISHSGNLGVGTTAPTRKLDVNGNAIVGDINNISSVHTVRGSSTGTNFIGLSVAAGTAGNGLNKFRIGYGATDNFEVKAADNLGNFTGPTLLYGNRTTGNVGIGITAPVAKLHVASGGNTANEYTAKFTSSPSVAGAGGIVFTNTEAATATGFKWHTTGTGVGTAADDDLILSSIDVASGATNTNNIFTIQGNGNIGLGVLNSANPIQHSSGARLTAAGVWTNASDRRLKTNIATTKYGLATIMQLKPVDYTMKKGGMQQVGFIAQEVQEIIPELVDGEEGDLENGETLGVAYGQMVAVLTKAIQEQQAQIEELKKQNNQLAEKNTALDKKNEQLETRVSEIDQLRAELSEIKNLLKSTSSNK